MSERGASGAVVRPAGEADVPAIAAIYRNEVLTGSASWEIDPPDADAMLARYRAIEAQGYPYLVADIGGRVVGFAYASAYRPRPGYRYTVEDSVYVAPDAQRKGAGRALLMALVATCAERGYRQMVAVIGGAEPASIGLHAAQGFVEVGRLPALGRKFGRWLDSVLMQRALGEGASSAPAQLPRSAG
jgi:L-amino acid N-acyltransferase YncA